MYNLKYQKRVAREQMMIRNYLCRIVSEVEKEVLRQLSAKDMSEIDRDALRHKLLYDKIYHIINMK